MDEIAGLLGMLWLVLIAIGVAPYLRKLIDKIEDKTPDTPKSDEHEDKIHATKEGTKYVEKTAKTKTEKSNEKYNNASDQEVVDRAWDSFRKPPTSTGRTDNDDTGGGSPDQLH